MDGKLNGPSYAILGLYDYLRQLKKGKPPPELYQHLDPTHFNVEKKSYDIHMTLNTHHRASMIGDFPLSASQRKALGYYIHMSEGEVLAVNGPPGTGKTTFLQSVIAHGWVVSALNQDTRPPLTLATSANNQAVTNVIEAFKDAPKYRWLPDIGGFGIYFPSGQKKEYATKKNIQMSSPNPKEGEGLFGQLFQWGFVTDGEQAILRECKNMYGSKVNTLGEALNTVQQDMRLINKSILDVITLIGSIASQKKLISEFCGQREPDQYESFLKDDVKRHKLEIIRLSNANNAVVKYLKSEPHWVSSLRFFGFFEERGRQEILTALTMSEVSDSLINECRENLKRKFSIS